MLAERKAVTRPSDGGTRGGGDLSAGPDRDGAIGHRDGWLSGAALHVVRLELPNAVTVPHTPRRAFSSPRAFHQVAGGMVVCTLTRRARFRVFRHTFHAKVFSVTRPIRSIAVFFGAGHPS